MNYMPPPENITIAWMLPVTVFWLRAIGFRNPERLIFWWL